MNDLYLELLNLVNNPEFDNAFIMTDHELDNKFYRIFNYRLVGWDTFQKHPNALESRGIMFDITDEDNVKIVSRPPKKFFNYAEGDVDHTKNELVAIHVKLDGSLISTYMHNGSLRLKSKGSINSQQAIDAMNWLSLPENKEFSEFLFRNANNYTFNMEWTSPKNRIVIGYAEDKLSVLSIRNNITGEETYVDEDFLFNHAKSLDINYDNITELVNTMYLEEVGEGYVLTFRTPEGEGYRTKVKNFKYCNLHKIKDSISNPEALAELIIRGQSDDVIEAFSEDKVTIDLIISQEHYIIPIFNTMVKDIQEFYENNKDLSRKDYAIKAKNELSKYHAAVMNLYIGREVDYEDYAIRNLQKFFGIKNVTYKK